MSAGLAPSKSTVYVSNLPFSLTNNDLHTVFERYGTVVKVTVVKDKETRKSKGVAFILFKERNDAHNCVKSLNNVEMFGRTLRVSIARDNGRAAEFIRRREYPDKSKCYECGDYGHLSHKCPKNVLGEREAIKKKRKRKDKQCGEPNQSQSAESVEDFDSEWQEVSWSDLTNPNVSEASTSAHVNQRKRYKKNLYFSDEEDFEDD